MLDSISQSEPLLSSSTLLPDLQPPPGLRICFVTSIHPDFDARVWKYATCMAARGHVVHLVCPWQVLDRQMCEGVVLHPFPRAKTRAARPLMNLLNLVRKLTPLLWKVDLFHFHDIDILPWMAVLSMVKPVIYDCHENYPDEMLVRGWIPNRWRGLLSLVVKETQALLSRVVHNVVFVVPEQKKDFPCDSLETIIVRNFASIDLVRRVTPDYDSRPDSVVFIGSNYEVNGTFLFLSIAERMLVRGPEIKFIMADRWADLATRDRALELIAKRQLTNVSIVPNVVPQKVIEHLNGATVGISADLRVPQRIKALPTKFFEYMAAGLPIVASDLPNAVCLADETQAILLCQPEDPETFVNAIMSLVEDRALARSMGRRGQQTFLERFSWESQCAVLEQFYGRVIRKGPSHSAILHPSGRE